MAKPDIWMPLYIGDYLADTMELTTEQHGAYLLLIMAYWKNGGALPNDDRKLAAITRLGADAWSMHKHTLASFFDLDSDPTLWVHIRAEKEMDKAGNNQEKRTLRAKNAAAARWGNDAPSNAPSNAPSIHQAMLEQCPSPSPSPLKEKQDQKTSSKPVLTEPMIGFDAFWKSYPRKVGKQDAVKAWKKIAPDLLMLDSIIAGLEKAKKSPGWVKESGQFIPHPASWLNGKRWEDDIDDFTDLPYDEIAETYNEICGKVFKACEGMPVDRKLRVRNLAREQWRGKTPFIEQGLPFWRKFFTACAQHKPWAGQNPEGRIASFDTVIRYAPAVLEGVRA